MARLIDADALKFSCGINEDGIIYVPLRDIVSATTIDAEPVRHGRWIDTYPDIEPNPMFMYGVCSECGFEQGLSNTLHYCPRCGAKMDEEDNT